MDYTVLAFFWQAFPRCCHTAWDHASLHVSTHPSPCCLLLLLLLLQEGALQAAISMYEGPLEAFNKQALRSALLAATAAVAATTTQHSSGTASPPPPATSTRTPEAKQQQQEWPCPAHTLAGQQAAGSSGPSLASSACSLINAGTNSSPQRQGVLDGPTSSMERKASAAAQESGGCDSGGGGGNSSRQQLYSTQLLQKATADPAFMARYLNTPKHERLRFWSEVRGGGAAVSHGPGACTYGMWTAAFMGACCTRQR